MWYQGNNHVPEQRLQGKSLSWDDHVGLLEVLVSWKKGGERFEKMAESVEKKT